MPRKTKSPAGSGGIRQRSDGLWEGRVTLGTHPGTGKQLRRSVYGKTQAEVVKKIQQIQAQRNNGTYTDPTRLTCGAWLNIWVQQYLGDKKEATQTKYRGCVKNHITPNIGAVPLQKLKPHKVQEFYNAMQTNGASAKTVRDVNGVLHAALQQAVENGYITTNPASACTLPRWKKKEMQTLDDGAVADFLSAIAEHQYETLFFCYLFTGTRQSELLGLSWKNVDFNSGIITISQQLLKVREKGGEYYIDTTKNDKARKIKPSPAVMDKLKAHKRRQTEYQLKAGPMWCNTWGLVFTNEIGAHLAHNTVRNNYKAIMRQIGQPALRLHDLRHSYAVISLANGDDVKTLQGNLGHATASFTLDVYGHVSERMQEESAARMEAFIQSIKGG